MAVLFVRRAFHASRLSCVAPFLRRAFAPLLVRRALAVLFDRRAFPAPRLGCAVRSPRLSCVAPSVAVAWLSLPADLGAAWR
ncbi:hypothetical protein [Actinoplanes xinjiangensis]|uniref:hypothetical protein n=1 Tax=Actinoplanes xinjiangensis TaxID=512350 RepID=UPI003439C91A